MSEGESEKVCRSGQEGIRAVGARSWIQYEVAPNAFLIYRSNTRNQQLLLLRRKTRIAAARHMARKRLRSTNQPRRAASLSLESRIIFVLAINRGSNRIIRNSFVPAVRFRAR